MSKVFFLGFSWLVTSTVAFIVAILTPFWIIKSSPAVRGIFEACELPNAGTMEIRNCGYLLLPSSNSYITANRTDYAIACASISIAAASIAIILLWWSGIHMCLKTKSFESSRIRLRTVELLIAGTLFVDALTIVVWVVMLAKNLDNNNVITTNQIGWSLWLAVASTGGFLISLVFFCIHRIDLGVSFSRRGDSYVEPKYLIYCI